MNRDDWSREDGLEDLSERLVDLVWKAVEDAGGIGRQAADSGWKMRAREEVRGELVWQVGAYLERLQHANQELSVLQEELRLQQQELAAQNRNLRDAQKTLRAERRRYQSLFDLAPDGYLVTDLEGVVQEANRAAATLLNVRHAFLAGKPLILFVDERDHDAFWFQLKRVRETESQARNWRLRMLPRDGSAFWAEITLASVRDRQGAPFQLGWLLRDVSDQVRLQAELQFQANLLDQLGDVVIAVDGAERVTYLNRRALEQYGFEPDRALGRKLSELYQYRFLNPDDERTSAEALAKGGRWRGRTVHLRQDGQALTVESTVTALGKGSRASGLLATIRDVTEQVVVERERDLLLAQSERDRHRLAGLALELARERDLLSTIMDSIEAQIAYLDAEFNFLRVNAPYCQGSGHAREALIGRNHFELFPNGENQALFEQARDTGEVVVARAKPFTFADQPERGTTYWDWTVAPVKDQAGEVQGVVLSLFEVTERVRARQARLARLARLRALIEVSEQVLAESSVEGVLARAVEAARELTGARIGVAGHGYREGAFRIGASSRAEDAPPCPSRELFTVERGGVYLDLMREAPSVRLTDEKLRTHPGWRGLPGGSSSSCAGHAPLRGLLGARLADREGQANGLIMVSDKGELDGTRSDFTEEDEALLIQLASLASLALSHIEARVESERLQHQNALILDSAGEGIVSLDAEGRILSANPAAAAMGGWPPQDLIGRSLHETFHHSKADGTPYRWEECLVTTTLADGTSFSVSDERFWRKDGTSFPVEYSSTPILEEGEIRGAVLVFRDILERQQAEQAIADLARFPNENPSPVIRISKEGTITYANSGSAPILADWGVGEGEPAPGEWQATVADAILSGADSGIELACGDRVFAFAVAPLPEYVNLYGLEITSLRRTEEALQRYAERLHVLRDMDQAILSARTAPEIAGAALSHLRRLVRYLRASVTRYDREAGETSLLAIHTGEVLDVTGSAERGPLPEGEFLARLEEGQVQVVEGAEVWDRGTKLDQVLRGREIRVSVHVPLLVRGELLGSLNLGMAASEVMGEDELEVVREVATELAIGIRQADLLAQVQRHAQELEQQVRRRTASLKTSRARFEAVFEEAAIGIALVSRRGRIVDSNPALQRMLGYERDELRGMAFSDLAHPDNVRDDADLYEELVEGGRGHYQVEGRYGRKDGRPIEAVLTVSLVRSARGRSGFAIALMEDVSERKRAQEALVESEKLALTGRMAASLAHEINNPLQSVVGCLSLAEEDMAEGRDAHEYIQIALEEVERAADLVAHMRDLNRPSQDASRQPTDANALVERVLTLTRKRCQERSVALEWTPAADLPQPLLLADRIQQVFMNLVLNAVDAMPEGGRLRVWTARSGNPDGVEVHFADTGVGIPEAELSHLFAPFYTTKETGMGLGLYVSHNIVREHGGRIEVDSVEGEGTAFTVCLPVQE